MKIKLNGEEQAFTQSGLNVTELLKVKNVDMPDMVSVELNGEILDRATFATTSVKEGDQIEFLYFMGGGER